MKQTIILISCFFFILPIFTYAQPDSEKDFVITNNNEKLTGSIKGFFKSKGVIIFLSVDGNKKTYSASDIQSFSNDSINFISHSNDFYKEITKGVKANLYQKITDNSGKIQYNGTEAVGFIKTTEGKTGDYYLLLAAKQELDLITKKNFEKYFMDLTGDNKTLQAKIKDGSLHYSQIVQVVELYNN